MGLVTIAGASHLESTISRNYDIDLASVDLCFPKVALTAAEMSALVSIANYLRLLRTGTLLNLAFYE